ncbi:hypothetical protein E5676_scaffold587G00080 [Cucumis melo var. makuwa]|uniref:Uncharacterized protein n=1 Tax=Cucumis melo var. makuwa TaxID=1194695 RepID=A0A5D3E1M2_CUCMM|nr:hypothetical protein E5676_scaffold587G00080 [Cucumis melo var. makuwa]
MFLKLESWKKLCTFKVASIFEGGWSSLGEFSLDLLKLAPPSAIQLLLGDDRVFAVRSTVLIHHPSRSNQTSSLFGEVTPPSAIQLLLRDDQTFTERLGIFVVWKGDSAVCDPTSTGRQSYIYREIHRLSRSDREYSSFGEVTPPSAIQLLLGNDQTFAVRSTILIYCPSRSDHASLSLEDVTLLSVTQLLLGDDQAFAEKSIVLIHRLGRSDWTSSTFIEVTPSSAIQLLLGDNQTFAVKFTTLVEAIEHLCCLKRGDSAVSDPISTGDDLTLVVRSTVLVGPIGHLRETERSCTVIIIWRDEGKDIPPMSSWRSKDGATPSSSSQGYNILEMR